MSIKLFDDFDAVFNNLFKKYRALGSELVNSSGTFLNSPVYNHHSDSEYHYYQLDLPGLDKKDVQIKLDKKNKLMTIKGERRSEYEDSQKSQWHVKQISTGHFERTFNLHQDSITDNVRANFNKGVLTVRVPRNKEIQNYEDEVTIE